MTSHRFIAFLAFPASMAKNAELVEVNCLSTTGCADISPTYIGPKFEASTKTTIMNDKSKLFMLPIADLFYRKNQFFLCICHMLIFIISFIIVIVKI